MTSCHKRTASCLRPPNPGASIPTHARGARQSAASDKLSLAKRPAPSKRRPLAHQSRPTLAALAKASLVTVVTSEATGARARRTRLGIQASPVWAARAVRHVTEALGRLASCRLRPTHAARPRAHAESASAGSSQVHTTRSPTSPTFASGHATIWADEPDPPVGTGVARTGVTVIVSRRSGDARRSACSGRASRVLNGAGELTGFARDRGMGNGSRPRSTSPARCRSVASSTVPSPPRSRQCRASASATSSSRWSASATTPGSTTRARCTSPPTTSSERSRPKRRWPRRPGCRRCAVPGCSTLGWKGGIGSASRICPTVDATLGVLVLSNFGSARDLCIDGVPIGETLENGGIEPPEPAGSCIAVVATDAPLRPLQLQRIARRCGLGLARMGSVRLPRLRRDLRRDLDRRSRRSAVLGQPRAPRGRARQLPQRALSRHRRGDRGGRPQRDVGSPRCRRT